MLILVAVTVSYSIKSGLLTKAQNAKIGSEMEEEKAKIGNLYQEYLVEKEIGKLEGTTFASYMSNQKIEGAKIEEGADDNAVTVKFAENAYTVLADGTILNNVNNNESKDEEYIIAIVGRDDYDELFCLYYADSEMSKTDLDEIIKGEVEYYTYGGNLSEGFNEGHYSVYFTNSNYVYSYYEGEWDVDAKSEKDNSFGTIKIAIFGTPITRMDGCFEDCELNSVPAIPSTVINLANCFHRTTFNLNEITTITIPKSVEIMTNLFYGAKNMNKIRIEYEGTINEYKEITNYNKLGSIGLVIHCSDGDYTTTESYWDK